MSHLKKMKIGLLRTAGTSGAYDWIERTKWRRDRLLILGYHGISLEDEHDFNGSLFQPREFLRRRFELIRRRNCNVLPLGEAVERLFRRDLPERALAITFDDGGYNFYKAAHPLLKEFGFPSTVYLTSFYSEHNHPVFTVASRYILWKGRNKVLPAASSLGINDEADLSERLVRQAVQRKLVQHAEAERFTSAEKTEGLRKLAELLTVDFKEICEKRLMHLMNLDEIKQIHDEGVDVQLHTHRHRVPLDRPLFERELSDNSRIISDTTGEVPVHFCYPSGDYREEFFPWLRDSGIVSATTCDVDLCSTSSNPFLLPRLIDTLSLSDVEFEGWLCGISHFLPQRVSIRR